MFDILIKNGKVIDGCANPWFNANLAIKNGKILSVGKGIKGEAKKVINADGNIICPGFINTHAHTDLRIFKHPEEETKLLQGYTTALFGQDGLSVAPIDEENKRPMMSRVSGLLGTYLNAWPWNSMEEYLDALENVQPGVNVMMLAPHGSIRAMGMGWDDRQATVEEIERMKTILAKALEEGACGFSTGLIYPPGMYADKNELIELCRVTGELGGIFVVHVRNEGDYLTKALQEVIEVCITANCPLHISHLKIAGKRNWGKSDEVLAILEEARENGLDVTFDQYPYIAGSTMLDAVIPPKYHSGGVMKMLERLKDPKIRQEIFEMQERINPEPWDNWVDYCGWDGILINAVKSEKNRFAEGKTVAEIAEITGKKPIDAVCDLLIEEESAVTMTEFYGSEKDVINFMRSDYMMLCTDGIAGGKPHPRVYGSGPRFVGKYVREDKALTLPQAIKKLTSMPAQRLGLQDRGLVKEGFVADIVIFDPDEIIDKGTFSDPVQFPIGINTVIVGGQIAVENGKLTTTRNGVVIRQKC
ncbi:MAG: N-acyl-D-amino-acid deacylase family protein [bacterium]